jgi:predicted transcriptional regulator
MLGIFKRGHGLFLESHADMETPVEDVIRGSVHAIPENEKISTALGICLRGYRNIPVTDRKGESFSGMVNSRVLLNYLGAGELHRIFSVSKKPLDITVSRLMETGHMCMSRSCSIKEMLSAFKHTGEEAIPLLNKGRLEGMITEADIVNQISGRTGVRVWELMSSKPIVARNNHPVSEVAGMLVKGAYSRLPVVRDSFLTGIVTSTDILSYLDNRKTATTLRNDRSEIKNAMNRFVETIRPEQDISEAVELMKDKGVAMLPVVDEYQIVGILTQRDILDAM